MVLFSPDIFSAQATGGISRCMIELMSALGDEPWTLWAGKHDNDMLAAALTRADFARRVVAAEKTPSASRFPRALVNEMRFAAFALKAGQRVAHRTYYPAVDVLAATNRVRQIHTLHDMWDECHARRSLQLRARSVLKLRALNRADAVICVSHHTRSELLKIRPELAARTSVIHHGVRRLSDAPLVFPADRPFFLFVGQRGSYKNFAVAVRALARSGLEHDLVCFGGGALTTEERSVIAQLGLDGRVRHCRGDDDLLAGAYERATALLYPSCYEGFGLPILEAMIHNCIVIAAPLTSLPEVGGEAAIYAAATDVEEWAAALRQVANGGASMDDRRALGRSRAAQFTWEKTATAHRDLYATLA